MEGPGRLAMVKWMLSAGVMIVAIGGLYWIRRESSMLDEDLVYAHYQEEVNAVKRLDAKTLCAAMAKEYRAVDTDPAGKRPDIVLDRDAACAATREVMQALYKVAKASKTAPDVKYTIESVTLSPDHRQATVKLRTSLSVGRRIKVETSGSEVLIRHMGEVRSLGSESRTPSKAR